MAAARNGAALDRSGSIATSFARIGPAGTIHSPTAGRSTCTPRWARASTVMSMWGTLGSRDPTWRRCSPTSKRGAARSSPETNWLDWLASISTSPPRTCPCPRTVKGSVQLPPSSMSTPTSRRAEIMAPMGRCSALSWAVTSTSPRASPATGVTNRMTVPACPQSTVVAPANDDGGITRRSGPNGDPSSISSIWTPSVRSASIMRAESSECSGACSTPGPSARAARTSSRLVRDFDPGTVTVASTAVSATGAAQAPRGAAVGERGEYPWSLIGSYPTERGTTRDRTSPAPGAAMARTYARRRLATDG